MKPLADNVSLSTALRPVAIGAVVALFALSATATEKQSGSRRAGGLEPGQSAPSFSLPGSDGKTHRLADHLGRRPVVIAWFAKAFTGG
jgi:peroxiredoxin Q/BCP